MTSIILLLLKLIRIYEMILVIRIILSWVQANPYNPIVQFIARITDPLLDATRRAFPFLVAGGLDLSPIVVFFLLEAMQNVIGQILFRSF